MMQLRTETIGANGVLVLDSANTFYLVSASAAVGLFLMQFGASENFPGIPPGTIIKRVKNWTANSQLTGGAGTQVSFFYGTESHREDSTEFNIATVTGSIPTSPGASTGTSPTNHADVLVPTVTVDHTIGANASRIYLDIGSLSTNAPATLNLRVQGGAGAAAAEGIELQPGTFVRLYTAGAVAVYNPDANAQTYWWLEQTT